MFDSPLRLFTLTWLGVLANVVALMVLQRSHGQRSMPLLVAGFCMFAGSAALVYWATFQLREGVRNERWLASEVEPLRRVMTHRAWRMLSVMSVLALIATIFIEKVPHITYWSVFVFSQAVTQLQHAFVVPRPDAYPRLPDWKNMQPLHSEHWGER